MSRANRRVVGWEDRSIRGITILPYALVWEEDRRYEIRDYFARLLGHAFDLERNEDGSITAAVEWKNEKFATAGFDVAITGTFDDIWRIETPHGFELSRLEITCLLAQPGRLWGPLL